MKRAVPLLLVLASCSGGGGPTEKPESQGLPPALLTAITGDLPVASMPRSVPAPDPLLLPGDLLHITVFRQADLGLEVRIPQDGLITYPLIGPTQAAGRTTAALEQDLRKRLEKGFLNEPSVTVTVKEYAKRKVYIVGGVTKPDGYEVAPTSRITILQLVAAAGGFTDRAYKEYVQVVRRNVQGNREVIRLSLVEVERLVAKGQAEADLELWPDDLVVIPSAVRVAYVLGAVNKPGNVDIPIGARMSVSMAVSNAGSYTKFAATGRVIVLRHLPSGETRKIGVDLDAVLNGSFDQDLALQPGDVVWVPERGIF